MNEVPRQFARRHAALVVAAWVALAVALGVWVEPAVDAPRPGAELYLPMTYESQAAQERLRELFPDEYRPSIAVIVLHRDGGLTSDDLGRTVPALVGWFADPTLHRDLASDEAEQIRRDLREAPVTSITTDPMLADRLLAPDGESTIVVAGMPDIFLAHRTQQAVRSIRAHLAAADLGGLEAEVTGDAGFYVDYDAAATQSVDRSTIVTIVLVTVILLAIYRSPVAIVVPIVTIGMAAHCTMRVLALLVPLGFEAGSVVQMFVVVLLFGSGTDYCLFIIARYKEQVTAGASLGRAMFVAWRSTAGAIAASALTTTAGLSLMVLAVFRAFQKAGPSVAVGLVMGCIAALTLAPALYLLAGRALFWPSRGRRPSRPLTGGLWERVAAIVTRRPGIVAVGVVVVLAVPAAVSLDAEPTHNIFDELADDWSSARGFEILKDGFGSGSMGPGTLLVEADRPLNEGPGWDLVGRLARRLGEHPQIDEVLWPGQPLGRTGRRFDTLEQVPLAMLRRQIEASYFAAGSHAARLMLMPADMPYTDRSIAAASELRRLAREVVAESPVDALVALAGPSSTIADIRQVARRDFAVVAAAVLVVVYAILLVVLRRPVLGLVLIAGTVLSFMAALGLAHAVFVGLLGAPGLDWKIRFFLLVLLVAVGVDYNIFVCTRIRQERRCRGLDDAVRVALARTGGIVSACGLIVAGTFASMIAGTLSLMVQLGFALAVGILVDTFLVRPLLVPAAALMLGRISERRRSGG